MLSHLPSLALFTTTILFVSVKSLGYFSEQKRISHIHQDHTPDTTRWASQTVARGEQWGFRTLSEAICTVSVLLPVQLFLLRAFYYMGKSKCVKSQKQI